MNPPLPTDVQLQYMRPAQIEAAARRFPVIYVPFGTIEWHGPHLPVGNDAIKAHAILVQCARKYGGVVYPPLFFPVATYAKGRMLDAELQHHVPVLTELFDSMKRSGFRVIIGVSGHNIPEQIAMINKALEPVVADGTVAGVGLWEMTLSHGPESDSDHAAKWETSNMLFFYPGLVDMAALGTAPLKPSDGISGLDPREHASTEIGRRNAELAADAIGKKAKELLESLPTKERKFRLKSMTPGEWWML